MIVLYMIASYLLGSIPWALIIGKVFYRTDVREHGSGNLGGTNAGRVLGKKAGFFVIILDGIKALLVVIVLSFIDKNAAVLSGLACTLGHCFPIFAGFKGGKGVATSYGYIIGVSLFVTHNFLLQFIVPFVCFLIILYLSKIVSFSSMASLSIAAIISYFQPNLLFAICLSALVALVIFQHRSNIKRIQEGTEKKISWM